MVFEKKYTVKLLPGAFDRMDDSPDETFYAIPRFVTHLDPGAIRVVTDLYRKYLPPGGDILDLMSSWVSHLPEEIKYRRVVGLGINDRELSRNKQLDEWSVHNLNKQPSLPYANQEFDGVIICVSLDYLIRPVEVLEELGRILKPGAPVIITYSNRCFETKAIAAWLSSSDHNRAYLIRTYLLEAGYFKEIELMDCSPEAGDPLYAVVARVR